MASHRPRALCSAPLLRLAADCQTAPQTKRDSSEFIYLIRPRSFLIVGNLNEFIGEAGGIHHGKYQSFQLYRRNMQEPEIITFDELLARAEGLVNAADA